MRLITDSYVACIIHIRESVRKRERQRERERTHEKGERAQESEKGRERASTCVSQRETEIERVRD